MSRKAFITIIIGVLIGIGLGLLLFISISQAAFFKDFLNKIITPFQPPTPVTTPPTQPQTKYESKVSYEDAIIKAVEDAAPAVVSIIVSKDLPVIEKCPVDPFSDLPDEFKQFFGPSQLYQDCPGKGTKKQEIGGGTGFIISSDGLILSNKHVASDSEASYTVLTNDGKKYDAKILALDPAQDIAIIKINSTSALPVVKLGDSDGLRLGQTVIAIGNALGEFRNTVSVGIISGLARKLTASGGDFQEVIEGAIQTDAAINRGNSGGPLLNLNGEVIGINTAIAQGAQNIGFAIPINKAKRAIESVKTTGKILTPYLGVRYYMVTEELVKKENLPVKQGVIVRGSDQGPAVELNSPAAKAGIQAEDIILEINGQKIDENNTLASLVLKYKVGDKVTLKILRAGKEIELKTILEERKS